MTSRFSASGMRRSSRTWRSQVLPTMVTTGVSARRQRPRLRSSAAFTPARRVEPKAATFACLRARRLLGGVELVCMWVLWVERDEHARAAARVGARVPAPALDFVATSGCRALPGAPFSRAVAWGPPFAVWYTPQSKEHQFELNPRL